MAACKGCKAEIRWMDTFPGGICVNCHRTKTSGATAEEDYKNIMQGFGNPGRVQRVQDLRRSNAAGPTQSKKAYSRQKQKKERFRDEDDGGLAGVRR